MTKNYLVTYKFYNRQGQRLTIFATTREGKINDEINCGLTIYIVKHSKTPDVQTGLVDKFDKKWVCEQFEKGQMQGNFEDTKINPTIVNLPCESTTSNKTFMHYCNNNFYKLVTNNIFGDNIGIYFEVLTRNSYNGNKAQANIIPSSLRIVKTLPKDRLNKLINNELSQEDSLKIAEAFIATIRNDKSSNN